MNNKTKEEIENILDKFKISNYEIVPNEDHGFIVNINGNVKLVSKKLKILPVKFGVVTGDFMISHNRLTSLKGSPDIVGGVFDCSCNQLSDLKYSPKTVKSFYCYNNNITSLVGMPEIKLSLYCQNNKLTSLNGCQQEFKGDFNCSSNLLNNLKNGPKEVLYSYVCYYNQLTSLEGCPKYVGSFFDCSNNKIKELDYWPDYVGSDFNVSSNQLTNLKGVNTICYNFDCGVNFISNLDDFQVQLNDNGKFLHSYIPETRYIEEIRDYYNKDNNPLKRTNNASVPKSVISFIILNNKLQKNLNSKKPLKKIKL